MFEVELEGADDVLELLGKVEGLLSDRQLNRILLKAMEAALLYLQENVPAYPPKPASSSYERTGTLGRTLTGEAQGAIKEVGGVFDEVYGKWGTRISYARWVIDEEQQAWMHQGRWWTLQRLVRQHAPGARQVMNQVLLQELRGSLGALRIFA